MLDDDCFCVLLTRRSDWQEEKLGTYKTKKRATEQARFFVTAPEFQRSYVRALVLPDCEILPDEEAA